MKNYVFVALIFASAGAAQAETLLNDVKSLNINQIIQISRSNDSLNKGENYAYLQDGRLKDQMDIDKPFCVIAVNSAVNFGLIVPVSLEVTSTGCDGEGLEVGSRAVCLKVANPLVKKVMCVSAISGPDLAPTIESTQGAVGSFISFK